MAEEHELRALLTAIRGISRAMDIHSRRINRESGLTLPQLIVLRCIGEHGEVTSRVISSAAGLSPPTVVGVLDKLEAKGMVERYRSLSDRRVVHTRLTRAGRGKLASSPSPLWEPMESEFLAMPSGRRAKFLEILEQAASLTEDIDPLRETLRDLPAQR